MSRTRGLAALALALLAAGCGGRGGLPPGRPARVKAADGREYYLVDKGRYKAYYDPWGRLARIEYDSNGDGRADQISHHGGSKTPHLIEVDENFDGTIDRWEDYDKAGKLLKVGTSRRGGVPDVWTFPGPDGQPSRKEYDDDHDGRIDRVDVFEGGRLVRVELDSDRDGRIDRWQRWEAGRLAAEELDTDGDGRPDRRLGYDSKGKVAGLEKLVR